MMTSWIEPYATKLELERRNEILILNIDRLDLEKQTSNNIIEAGFIEYGDWESLKTYITEEDVKEEIEESRAFISETKPCSFLRLMFKSEDWSLPIASLKKSPR